MAAIPKPRRKALRRVLFGIGGLALVAGSCAAAGVFDKPRQPFDQTMAPPAPDYAQGAAWLAFPGRDGIERSAPPGTTAIDENKAPVDVFFIHPTTYQRNDVWNVAWDAPAEAVPLDPPVLLDQVSVFNGCCRIYAPRYRQTSVRGLSDQQAVALAYDDVARAFRWYLAHENRGRPFIIASHSQGTLHAVQLLQREVLGTPLQGRLVAAYLIGGYVPADFARIGLPTCDAPKQTGCVLSYNTAKPGARLARVIIEDKTYWWQGSLKSKDQPPAICVDPLSWRANGSSPASANRGSHPFPEAPFPTRATALAPLLPKLTGATCRDGMLEADLGGRTEGFASSLSRFFGSYHLNDYGLFYASLRQNAIDRVAAWQARRQAPRE